MTESNETLGLILSGIWIPFVTYLTAISLRYKQDNKERDVIIQSLREDMAVSKATHITREEVTLIIDCKLGHIEEKLDKISQEITSVIRALPKREGEQ